MHELTFVLVTRPQQFMRAGEAEESRLCAGSFERVFPHWSGSFLHFPSSVSKAGPAGAPNLFCS